MYEIGLMIEMYSGQEFAGRAELGLGQGGPGPNTSLVDDTLQFEII